MEQWANLVISGDMSRYSNVFDCYKAHAEKPQFADALETILDASDTIIGRIEDIRSEALRGTPVADARLREVGRWASSVAFTKDTAAFPVVMFKDVQATDLEGQRRDFVLQHCDKGEFTQPVMAQLPINEDEWYAETIKHQVAGFVMADILRQLRLETVDGGTPDQYWAQVKRFRDRTVAEGRRPVLLVENPTVPEWIWEWSLTEWEKDRELPHGLALTRSAEFAEIEDYMGNFGDVAVFNAPIAPGASYLLSDAVFERIDFTRHGDSFVRVTWEPVENEGRLIDVTLSWHFKLYLQDLAAVKLAYGQRDSH
jgi:hypothetical protein